MLTLSGSQDANCRLWNAVNNAPKVLVGIPGYPCEIIAKLNSFIVNNGVMAGVFVGYGMNQTNPYGRCLAHKKTAGGASEGIIVHKLTGSSGSVAYDVVAVTTLPIWLKIRINAGPADGNTITFWYSTDGTNWTQYQSGGSNLVVTDYFSSSYGVFLAGVFANNSTDPDDSAFAAPFEFFKIERTFGPR